MPVNVIRADLAIQLEKELDNNKNIFILDSNLKDNLDILINIIRNQGNPDNVVWQCIDKDVSCEQIMYISRMDMNEIINLYHIYDFSDKVCVIHDSVFCGNLSNYVKNGLITNQVLLEAYLYNIKSNG